MTESSISREALVHQLYEAAELEHNLMCTYLYAAFSLRQGTEEGLSAEEADATARWRRAILKVAIEEMGHLTAVWNITAALGGSPRFGRLNFPLDPGGLPANVVVRLAPFSEDVLQHFIYLERPTNSVEPDGSGFDADFKFTRGDSRPRVTPMPIDYETVGAFYETLSKNVKDFVARVGEKEAFCGDRNLQLSRKEIDFQGCDPVICSITALKAFDAIVSQGEGASTENADSHYCRFIAIRDELRALRAKNPDFQPAFPAAVNPVLRRPVRAGRARVARERRDRGHGGPRQHRVHADAAADLAFLSIAAAASRQGAVRGPGARPHARDDAAGRTRRAAARGPDESRTATAACRSPRCATPRRCRPASVPASSFSSGCTSCWRARRRWRRMAMRAWRRRSKVLTELTQRAERTFANIEKDSPASDGGQRAGARAPRSRPPPPPRLPARGAAMIEPGNVAPTPRTVDGVDYIEGRDLTLIYEGKKCIHSRFCVTWGPKVFIANVKGPWINPDAMATDALTEIAHVCVSGAIRYKRKDGQPDEAPPPVNLVSVREGGPYAIRADIRLDGAPAVSHRLTLCRCGASKNKPFCDGSHHEVNFAASGEPPTGKADMLPVRDGPLAIDPLTDGPLQVRGNMEIISGTGRVVARMESARLCRCGASNTKPFCDGSHARVGLQVAS